MNFPPWPQSDEREIELLRMVLENPQWGGFHPYVKEFEQSFAAYQHSTFGISAANGTLTLELALAALGIGPGDEVIIPAISFIATATSVSRTGATPVFVDIEPWSFNIDPDRVREAVGEKTKAVMPVHFGGAMCRMDELISICREFNLHLFEDAAQAHGAEWNGKRAGSFGIGGSFSFQNGKVLSSGEGGMLVTSDEEFAATLRSLANHGRAPGRSFYEHYALGTNFRMTAFQAAVLLAQFERLPEQINLRSQNAAFLKREVQDMGQIVWQEQPSAITRNPQYLLLGRIAGGHVSRDEFCQTLAATGVPCTPFYPHTLYQNPLYKKGGCRVMPCPNAEACLTDGFWLPHRVLLADEETMEELVRVVRGALTGESTGVTAASGMSPLHS